MKTLIKSSFTAMVLFLLSFHCTNAQKDGDDIIIGKYAKLFSKILNEERTLLISLPIGYQYSTETYPVLYLLDGEDPGFLGEANSVRNSLALRQPVQYSPNMIIVAIANTDRSRDMLGSETSPKFLKFITEELFPFINKGYRADENKRILYGGSDAGVFVMYSFLENPDNFTGYIVSSPTLFARNEYFFNKTKELLSKNINLNRYLYVTYGGNDFKEVLDYLKIYLPVLEELKQKGLRLEIKFVPDADHMPYGGLHAGLKQMYEGFGFPEEKMLSEGVDSLKAYYVRYSKTVGYTVNPPLGTVSTMGMVRMMRKKTRESVTILEYGQQLYPQDPYINKSLAEAYYRDNNLELAKKQYFRTKEMFERLNLNVPPSKTWTEMKEKFEK
jgi:uncharacterized protein